MIAFIGDVHSNFNQVHSFMGKNPYIKNFITCGDLGVYFNEEVARGSRGWKKFKPFIKETLKRKKKFKHPLFFCHGNDEDWHFLKTKSLTNLNIHYCPPGTIKNIDGRDVAFLGGTNPKEGIEKLKNEKFEILVSYIGPSEFLPNNYKGCKSLKNFILTKQPSYVLHGAHHINYYKNFKETTIRGLGLFATYNKSYMII